MFRKSLLPQKGKARRNNFAAKCDVRRSFSIPEKIMKKINNVEEKNKETDKNVLRSNDSEEVTSRNSGSDLSWIDYLPSDTYYSDSEEDASSVFEGSIVFHNNSVEVRRSQAAYFGEDFDDIVHTIDGYLDINVDFQGNDVRPLLSLDVSSISVQTMQAHPNKISKFQPPATSTPLCTSGKEIISADTGPEITLSLEMNNTPEMKLLLEIPEPEEPPPPCMEELSTEELKIPDVSSVKLNTFGIKQSSKNSAYQALKDITQVSKWAKESFNIMDRRPIENTLTQDSIFSSKSETSPKKWRTATHKKIEKSQENRKQKSIKSSNPVGNEIARKQNLNEINDSEHKVFPLQEASKSTQNLDNNLRDKYSANIFSFPDDDENEIFRPSVNTKNIPKKESKENLNPISVDQNTKKKKKLKKTVPICPLFGLFKMKPAGRLRKLPPEHKPFKHQKGTPQYDYSNVTICPLEIFPARESGPRKIHLVSSEQNR